MSDRTSVPIVKSTNTELKQATFITLAPETVDAHGDIYDENEVRKACHDFNLNCNRPNLMHYAETDTFKFVESYIAPVDFQLGEEIVKAGSWIQVLQFEDDDIWQAVKDGSLCGLSVGCKANVEDINNEE